MKLLQAIGNVLAVNLVAILFLLGMILLNVATYLHFDYVVGMTITGLSVIIIALILQFEKAQQ